jgi:hypothetical protein
VSRGPGRIERAIRNLLDANPDEAFTIAMISASPAIPRWFRDEILPAVIRVNVVTKWPGHASILTAF